MTGTEQLARRRPPVRRPPAKTPDPAPGDVLSPAARILALQRSAGNRATARLLARPTSAGSPGVRMSPQRTGAPAWLTLQRDPNPPVPTPTAFVGDPKKAGDTKYANQLGKDDAARLQKSDSLSDGDRADVRTKLKYFTGNARDAYLHVLLPVLADFALKAETVDRSQVGNADYVGTLLDVIQKLKAERINSWKNISDVEETEVALALLEAVVASVALGLGGVVGELASASLEKGLFKTFVDLAALEAGDIAVEQGFKAGVASTAGALNAGAADAVIFAADNCKTALTNKNQPGSTGNFNVYAEAMRLQTLSEQLTTGKAFQTKAASTYDKVSLAGKIMSLESVHKELAATPEIFHRLLTEGFMRLLHAEHTDPDKPAELGPQAGTIFLLPDIGSRNWLGKWFAPDLDSFTHFYGSTRGLNAATLMSLDNAKVEDLKVDLQFAIDVTNAYSGWFQNPFVRLWIDRDATGGVRLRGADDDDKEWLGSFYSGINRELTDDERNRYAPLGAAKLYEAIKGKLIHRPKNADKLVPD